MRRVREGVNRWPGKGKEGGIDTVLSVRGEKVSRCSKTFFTKGVNTELGLFHTRQKKG